MMNINTTVQNGSVQFGHVFQPGVVGSPSSKDVDRSRDNNAVSATEDLNSKRPRLSSQPVAHTNGLKECPLSSTATTDLQNTFDAFRKNFNEKLKGLLTSKLDTYFTHLETVEQQIASIRSQHKDLICRMDGIETASKQLTKLINDKCTSLPAPSTTVGQRRTLSSQAPRLPPPPLLQPVTDTLNKRPMTSDSARVTTSVSVGGITSPAQTPIATVAPQQKRQISTHPSGNLNLPPLETCSSVHSTINPVCPPVSAKPKPCQTAGKNAPVSAPVTTAQSPLQQPALYSKPIHPRSSISSTHPPSSVPTETIDLTESEPAHVEATTRVELSTSRSAVVNSSPRFQTSATTAVVGEFLQRNCQPWTTTLLASFGQSMVQPLPQRQPSRQQQQQWISKPVLPPSNQHPPPSQPPPTRPLNNISNTSAASKLLSLTVAPLPPTPIPTIVFSIPTQPMPQLTIAEAVEGICLQWSISGQTVSYEPAVTYEIFSYASSDVTLTSICSSVPWKKIGDVAALPLPMACTLTHIQPNNIYYFIIRSVDRFERYSAWSNVVHAFVS